MKAMVRNRGPRALVERLKQGLDGQARIPEPGRLFGRAVRDGLFVALLVLAPLSRAFAADAGSPASAIEILGFDWLEPNALGARNDCWENAPPEALVACAPPAPEHGAITVTVTLEAAAPTDVDVEYESTDLTATGGEDYVALDGEVTIAAGETEGSFRVQFIDDLVEEGREAFFIQISAPAEVNLLRDHIHVTIIDEESIRLSLADAADKENAGGVRLTGTLSEPMFWAFRIRTTTTDGTATAPYDYQAATDEVSHWLDPEGRTFQQILFTHRIFDDNLDEPDETYQIAIAGNDYLSMDSVSATLTILDDDSAPSLSISDDSGLEDSVGNLSFTVKLDAPSGKEITVDYATADIEATMGVDYTHEAGTLTFTDGQVEQTVSVSVTADDVHEGDETFRVTLSDEHNATVADRTAVGTIVEDDARLSIADAAASEADGELTFLVTAEGLKKPGQTATVDYRTADDTAAAGSDYAARAGTLTFTSDATGQEIAVTVFDDPVAESDETFLVNLTNATNAIIGDATAQGTIRDDDVTSTEIALTAAPARVREDALPTPVVVTATLDAGARTEAAEVTVNVAGSGAADAVDFEAVSSFTIVIAAGDTSGTGTFTLTPIDDDVDESDETLSLTGTSILPVTGTAVELADDDPTSSSIALTADPTRVSEGDGATPVEVTATLDAGARTEATTVTVSVAGSGDPDAVDFDAVQDFTIAIAAGARTGTGTFTLTPEDDNVVESDETLTVTGNSPLDVTEATVALADNDQSSTAIELLASPGRIGEEGGAQTVQVTAALDSGARTAATTVMVSVTGSGDSDAVDYAATPTAFEIEIAAGETGGTATFTVTPEDDEVDEVDEILDVSGTSDLAVTPTSVTLTDDDPTSTEVLLSAVPATISEGAGATPVEVTATLDAGARTVATTVTVSVTGSGDPDVVDFAAVPDFTVTIAPGEASGTGTFTLTPVDDNATERSEMLTVAGTAAIPVRDTTVTITDNDAAPRLSIAGAAGVEGGVVNFVVSLAGSSGRPVTVSYATRDGTAVAQEDYEAVSGMLTFAPGESALTVPVSILDDAVYEPEEHFSLELSSPENATLALGSAIGTIVDDDRAQKAPTKGQALLFESTTRAGRQGFVRVINHSAEAGEFLVEGFDDSGMRVGTLTLTIGAARARHFNSDDFESGNIDKGIPIGVGPPSAGSWRLELSSELDIEVLSYARTADGFVTSLHDTAPATVGVHRAVFLNPGGNVDQVSRLRLINPGSEDARVTITGTDDMGGMSAEVVVNLPAGTAREWTAAELESGTDAQGALGSGDGKWRLDVSSNRPVVAMSLIESPTHNLTNLSTMPHTPGRTAGSHVVPLFPSASDALGRQGFVRVVNRSGEEEEVRIEAFDQTGWEYEPLALTIGADEVASFNSHDLELGNADKGLTGSTGAGDGDWWLELSSDDDGDIAVFAYIRTTDGFLTSMHDLVPVAEGAYRVVFFNPAENVNQVSVLWLVNPGDEDAQVTVAGVDDSAVSPGSAVRTTVPAGSSRRLSSMELESGESDAIDSGALGVGVGKWRLRVESDQPIRVMSLLENPTGHLTNLSTATERDAGPEPAAELPPVGATEHAPGFAAPTTASRRSNAPD